MWFKCSVTIHIYMHIYMTIYIYIQSVSKLFLSIMDKEMLKSSAMIVNLSISLFSIVQFSACILKLYYQVDTYFRILLLFNELFNNYEVSLILSGNAPFFSVYIVFFYSHKSFLMLTASTGIVFFSPYVYFQHICVFILKMYFWQTAFSWILHFYSV